MLLIFGSAWQDIKKGWQSRRVWLALAHEDIGDQHRRTALGPIWLLINYLIYMGTFIVIFQHNSSIPHFAAYSAIGLLVFFFFQEILIQSVSLFYREESLIKGTTLPLSVYILRLAMQSIIRTSYALAGCLIILAFSEIQINMYWLLSLVGLVMIILMVPPIIIIFAIGGVFFPDLQFIVRNLVRVSLFLSPIFWTHADGMRGILYKWNPLTYLIEVVRIPILEATTPINPLCVIVVLGITSWTIALLLLGKFRDEIVFAL